MYHRMYAAAIIGLGLMSFLGFAHHSQAAEITAEFTSPIGGEVWTQGETKTITWTTSPNVDKVTIGYKTCPSCLGWIVNNVPNSGSIEWDVFIGNRGGDSTEATLQLTAYETGTGSTVVTSQPFTVLHPHPTVEFTYPNRLTPISFNQPQTLTWAGDHIETVSMEVTCSGNLPTTRENVFVDIPNTGSFNWNPTDTCLDGHNKASFVVYAENSTSPSRVWDRGEFYFTSSTSSPAQGTNYELRLTWPTTTDPQKRDNTQVITWEKAGDFAIVKVEVDCFDDAIGMLTLANVSSTFGYHNWKPSNTCPNSSTGASVRISSDYANVSDTAYIYFQDATPQPSPAPAPPTQIIYIEQTVGIDIDILYIENLSINNYNGGPVDVRVDFNQTWTDANDFEPYLMQLYIVELNMYFWIEITSISITNVTYNLDIPYQSGQSYTFIAKPVGDSIPTEVSNAAEKKQPVYVQPTYAAPTSAPAPQPSPQPAPRPQTTTAPKATSAPPSKTTIITPTPEPEPESDPEPTLVADPEPVMFFVDSWIDNANNGPAIEAFMNQLTKSPETVATPEAPTKASWWQRITRLVRNFFAN